eukprot:TRINITY_DN881_c0_g7_i4.p3 TRINITY_DN881_c0_g7~~TRINITY_DN881_c0_g7_i4.p3  ORF type:complete len:156 (-),score=77.09 TRINITY_DN881_c0_g7_i4:357-824(-)
MLCRLPIEQLKQELSPRISVPDLLVARHSAACGLLRLLVADLRSADAYAAGHLVESVSFPVRLRDLDTLDVGPLLAVLLSQQQQQQQQQQQASGPTTVQQQQQAAPHVVLVDDGRCQLAAAVANRLVYRYVPHVSILSGGYDALHADAPSLLERR